MALTAALLAIVIFFVNLKPKVDQNFFFSSNDPQFRESNEIDKLFPSGSQLILSVSSPDIESRIYLERLARLTGQIQEIKGVSGVRSLADGPKDFEDARKSPFWRRLLLAKDGRSSNVIVFVPNQTDEQLMREIEADVTKAEAKDFHIRIAGAPYVADMIGRSLLHDFRHFTLTAIGLFSLAMWIIFRSARLVAGMLATCVSSVLLMLLVQALLGQRMGILTANLGTIIFVVALSHLVYMTFNWERLRDSAGTPDDTTKAGASLASKARRMTFPASFWSMVCASLGFGSLLLVPAKPLRELGYGGLLGTAIALVCAYLMYPAFLTWAEAHPIKTIVGSSGGHFWERRFVWTSIAVVLVSAGLSFGLGRLDTDPSLLDYFKKDTPLREGLEYVDRNGGSSPLTLVVAARDGGRLDNRDEYDRMWDLQDALEQDKHVGTVVSLPVLMAEGNRHPLAFLFSWKHLINIMEEPKHQRVAATFITADRKEAAFYLRMIEQDRKIPRMQVIDDLRAIVTRHGFRPVLAGGIYELQGALAHLVSKSLVTGLFSLLALFAVIALFIARSLRTAAAMIFSLSLMPVCMLGGVGLLHVPVDIISAPATNVCIGMAMNSMVHLMFAVKRAERDGKKGWEAWVAARNEQWRGIVFSDAIIAAGFAIFVLSDFPPTQRFGLVVVAGTVVDILANLFVLPLLGGAARSRRIGAVHPRPVHA